MSGMVDTLAEAGVRKALNILASRSIVRSYVDLELLISYWSVETLTFITTWGEFTPMLKDVVVMFRLPQLAKHDATGIVLSEEEEGTL